MVSAHQPRKRKRARQLPGRPFVLLRMGSRLLTRSQRSRRDGFSLLAPSRKCERLRIQVVRRREPGRSQ